MKAEQAKKIADQALEQLADALAHGKSEALTRYLAMLAKFHKYSFGNVLMILSQKPDATHVAGFHTWRQMGRFVKKGEKGIVIIAPMLIRKRDERDSDGAEEAKPVLRFRGVYVFDVSQTDGEALPEPARVNGIRATTPIASRPSSPNAASRSTTSTCRTTPSPSGLWRRCCRMPNSFCLPASPTRLSFCSGRAPRKVNSSGHRGTVLRCYGWELSAGWKSMERPVARSSAPPPRQRTG